MKRLATITVSIAKRVRSAWSVLLGRDCEAGQQEIVAFIEQQVADVKTKYEHASTELKSQYDKAIADLRELAAEHFVAKVYHMQAREEYKVLVNAGVVKMIAKADFYRCRN